MSRKNGIGSHTKPNVGKDTIWLTPRYIIEVLGPFDLDPCAAPSPRPWATAKRHIEEAEDGLGPVWPKGRIWLNPPYDERLDVWMNAMAQHAMRERGDPNGIGIALLFARVETYVWQRYIWPFCDAVMFPEGRFTFCFPDGTKAPFNSGGPSALVSYSDYDSERLRNSGIMGTLVKPIFRQENNWLLKGIPRAALSSPSPATEKEK
jgi:hypothetical protein